MNPPRQHRRALSFLSFAGLLACLCLTLPLLAQSPSDAPGILNRDQAGPLLPATVFYSGQVAPIQARNSAGVRLGNSKLVLAALVDTSGYASSVQQTYQAYLIAETPVRIGDSTLAAGAYGFGFVLGDRFVAMDLGGHQVLTSSTTRDSQLARPNPLQILPDPTSSTRFRLYLGRYFVTLEPVAR